MIRPATGDDTPAILAMAEKFYATTSYAQWADFDADSTAVVVDMLRDHGVLLLAESDGEVVGMIGLILSPSLCNASKTLASEVMWWVDAGARGGGAGLALLRSARESAVAKGADAVQMVHLENSPPQAAALYERLGYRRTESCYTSVVN